MQSDPVRNIKAAIRRLKPYSLARPPYRIKLNQNENPFDLPLTLKDKLLQIARETNWGRYPPFVPQALKERLAAHTGVPEAGILIGNGSNELLQVLLLAILGPQERIVLALPTFMLYEMMGEILGGTIEGVYLKADMSFDGPALAQAAAHPDTRLTLLCSPNNPTGSTVSRQDLVSILESTGGLVVVDEAYYEFSEETMLPLLADYPHLVVTRTFSKAMGLAGLRVGYLLAHPNLASQIEKVKLPYNVNFFSLQVATHLLDEQALLQERISAICRERQRVFQILQTIPGIQPFPSQANFILFALEGNVEAVFQALVERGILIRNVSRYPRLNGMLRVTIGTERENNAFLEALQKIVG